jgi:endonuclease/exonuclease/phosphatase family metal-dependent hydrolase
VLMSRSVTIATWNVQWRRSESEAAGIIRDRLAVHQPDVICLTEAPADFLSGEGHTILCDPDTGYPVIGNRRKVVLWSKAPWTHVDDYGSPGLPCGRFAAGTTQTDLGPLRFVGVCIPWAGSHVSSGRRDRQRWEEHLSYLEALAEVLEQQEEPYIVLGDFNQAVPRRIAPREVFSSLISNVANKCHLVTTGEIEGCGYAIDHIAVSDGLGAVSVKGLSAKVEHGPALSDHFGLVTEVARRG